MALAINGVSKRYGEVAVLENFTLHLASGQVTTILGPSGCGKTTLLNMVARLEAPDSGAVLFDSNGERVGYMTQEPMLLPWRTLGENARLGIEVMSGSMSSPAELGQYFTALELAPFIRTYPHASSGGMKQRVALIRTLLTQPRVVLLDEPFSNLDFDIKLKVQQHVLDYHLRNAATTILVTHDIEDAIALSDSVVVLSERPATIKAVLQIDLGISKRSPVEARKSPRFRDYFVQIWGHLKYLGNGNAN